MIDCLKTSHLQLSLFPEFNTLSVMYGKQSADFISQEAPFVLGTAGASRGAGQAVLYVHVHTVHRCVLHMYILYIDVCYTCTYMTMHIHLYIYILYIDVCYTCTYMTMHINLYMYVCVDSRSFRLSHVQRNEARKSPY